MTLQRTKQQIEADRLDLQAARLIDGLHDFADRYKAGKVKDMAIAIATHRYQLRQHMHAKDREATS